LNAALAKRPGNKYNQRWGIWTTMTLKNSDGDVYLFRRRIFQTPMFALYLHDIEQGDEITEALHSHPFPFVSFILRGGYTEHVGWTDGDKSMIGDTYVTHGAGSTNIFPRGHGKVHTIVQSNPGTKTLVFAGRRRDSWGWFVEGEGLIHWSEYLIRIGHAGRDPRLPLKSGD
jgi:hypothetical protein